LRRAKTAGCPLDLTQAVFVGAPDRVIRDPNDPVPWRWRVSLFAFLFRNAVHAVDLFRLPPENYVEIVRQIEI
jgi:KUP system potassium uptake protein